MDAKTVSGGCLCGQVRFEIAMPTLICVHCHCSLCRRAHGAGFVTWVTVPANQFQLTAGREKLTRYRSSDHGTRSFCGRCGSTLLFETSHDPGRVDIALANVAGEIDRAPQMHIYFDDRAAWVDVQDGLPRCGGDTGFEPLS